MSTKPMEADLRDMLRYFANRADPSGTSKGTDADLMRQAANALDACERRIKQLEQQQAAHERAEKTEGARNALPRGTP